MADQAALRLASTVVVVSFGLVCLGLAGIGVNVREGMASQDWNHPSGSTAQHAIFDPSTDLRCGDTPPKEPTKWSANLEVQEIDVSKHTITVAIHLCSYGRQHFFTPTQSATIEVSDARSGFSTSLLARVPTDRVPSSVTVELPAIDVPDPYPSDAYRMDLYVAVRQPPTTSFETVPLDLSVRQGPGLFGSDVRWAPIGILSSLGYYGSAMVITRGPLAQGFVYAMALLPLVLIVMLTHLFAAGRETPRIRDVRDLLLPMAGVFLTVLPLRTVLVSSDIKDITRVDLILATELATLLLIVAIVYARSVGAPARWRSWFVKPAAKP